MSLKTVFLSVTACALGGMVLGGVFGYWGGHVAPDFFEKTYPWGTIEPVGFATFLGATAGVLLGGTLGGFGIVVQLIQGRRGDQAASSQTKDKPDPA